MITSESLSRAASASLSRDTAPPRKPIIQELHERGLPIHAIVRSTGMSRDVVANIVNSLPPIVRQEFDPRRLG